MACLRICVTSYSTSGCQPVIITFAAGMFPAIRGKLVDVDERWLALEQEKGIAVVAVTSVVTCTPGRQRRVGAREQDPLNGSGERK